MSEEVELIVNQTLEAMGAIAGVTGVALTQFGKQDRIKGSKQLIAVLRKMADRFKEEVNNAE